MPDQQGRVSQRNVLKSLGNGWEDRRPYLFSMWLATICVQGGTIFWKYDNPSPNKITERGETLISQAAISITANLLCRRIQCATCRPIPKQLRIRALMQMTLVPFFGPCSAGPDGISVASLCKRPILADSGINLIHQRMTCCIRLSPVST
jgi:hypothetical protein